MSTYTKHIGRELTATEIDSRGERSVTIKRLTADPYEYVHVTELSETEAIELYRFLHRMFGGG